MLNHEEAFLYADLILRHLKNDLSEKESALLQQWLDKSEANRKFMALVQNEAGLSSELEFFSSVDTALALKRISSETYARSPDSRISIRQIYHKWKQVAAVLLIASSSVLLYQYAMPGKPDPSAANVPLKNDILPGSTRAILSSTDGTVQALTGLANDPLTDKSLLLSGTKHSGKDVYNTITTPRGGEYKVILPDGTKVWLNASSSITYPMVFSRSERKVRVNGEAYFEVEKNKSRPFKVLAGDVEISVLGTHFNVKAYREEQKVSTTLLEGAVKVSKGNTSQLLVPGQELSIVDEEYYLEAGPDIERPSRFQVKEANTEGAVAWKNGEFQFNNDDIKTVMMQISRWYDAEITYEGTHPDLHFTGKISRYSTISKVLSLLELTGGVHFKIEGQKVIVMN